MITRFDEFIMTKRALERTDALAEVMVEATELIAEIFDRLSRANVQDPCSPNPFHPRRPSRIITALYPTATYNNLTMQSQP